MANPLLQIFKNVTKASRANTLKNLENELK